MGYKIPDAKKVFTKSAGYCRILLQISTDEDLLQPRVPGCGKTEEKGEYETRSGIVPGKKGIFGGMRHEKTVFAVFGLPVRAEK